MQTHGGAEAQEVILSNERRFRVRFRIDWNRDGGFSHGLSEMSKYVEDIVTDRALKGSAPEEIMLIEGSSAAELDATIGGEYLGMQMPAIFSPYNGLSPLYTKVQIGSEVRYDIGVDTALGTVWYPQFVGNIAEITPDRKSNTVRFRALDRVEKLRRPVLLAPWAVSDYWRNRGRTLAQLADTQGFIQNCLQLCDTSATRYRPTYRAELNVPENTMDGVLIFLPFAGSIVPTVGWIDNAQAMTYPNTEGGVPMYRENAEVHPASPEPSRRPFALSAMGATTDGNALKYWVSDRSLMKIDGTHYFGMTLNTDPAFTNGSWHVTAPDSVLVEFRCGMKRVLRIHVGSNQMWTSLTNENNGFVNSTPKLNIPAGNAVDVFVQWDTTSNTGTRAYMEVGANKHVGWQYISNGYPGDDNPDPHTGLFTVYHRMSMTDVSYGFRNMYGTAPGDAGAKRNTRTAARYAAVLDAGANTLSMTPDSIQGKDAWDVIKSLAEAEFGSVFWDETGVFRFWNYNRIKALQDSPVRTIDTSQIMGLELSNSLDSVRNTYSVATKKQTTGYGNVYIARSIDEFYVPGGSTRTFAIFVDDVQMAEPRKLARHTKIPLGTPTGNTFFQWDEWSHHGYVMQLLGVSGWAEPDFVNVELDVTAWFDTRGVLMVRIVNPWSEAARLAVSNQPLTPNAESNPALRIGGTKILKFTDQSLATKDQASINNYGERNYEVSGDWYQEFYALEGLMNVLLPRTSKPIPTTQNIEIAGDPRLQLGDVLTLDDPDGMGELMRLQIFGITRRFNKNRGLVDTLSVELLRPAGVGIWDSAQYGRWDQSFIWS